MNREEAIKQFWQVSRDGRSGVLERALDCQFNDVMKKRYIGSEFDNFIKKIYDAHEAELKAKDERTAELEAKIQNMCAECECAKFADNAIKPSEMWKLHTILKDDK